MCIRTAVIMVRAIYSAVVKLIIVAATCIVVVLATLLRSRSALLYNVFVTVPAEPMLTIVVSIKWYEHNPQLFPQKLILPCNNNHIHVHVCTYSPKL